MKLGMMGTGDNIQDTRMRFLRESLLLGAPVAAFCPFCPATFDTSCLTRLLLFSLAPEAASAPSCCVDDSEAQVSLSAVVPACSNV